jgi:hypothetical protein
MSDTRIPLRFGALKSAGPDEALVSLDAPPPGRAGLALPGAHRIGCECCVGRDIWAESLSGLFLARVKGAGPQWCGVRAELDAAGEARLRRLLAEDLMLRARFRIEE